MSTEPHERLLQMLSAMLIQLNTLQSWAGADDAPATPKMEALHDGLHALEQMTREALYVVRVVRTSNDDMLLSELEGVTLSEALALLLEETAEKLSLSSRVSFSGIDAEGKSMGLALAPIVEHVLYMVAHEALYQAAYHTGARRLRLMLNYGSDEVQMSVEDDGTNIEAHTLATDPTPFETPLPPFTESASITGMRNASRHTSSIIHVLRLRVEALGGSLEIGPVGERGTRVLARIPSTPHLQTTAMDTSFSPVSPEKPVVALPETNNAAPSSTEPIRLLIVDHQAVIRAGLHHLLESYPGVQVVGEAADGVQAVSETLELGPQVVLMDTQLPNGQSLEALRQIKQLNLETKVLFFSTEDREEYLYETLRAGADGYVLKDIAPDELIQAIRAVARGEVPIQPQLAGRLLSRFGKQGRSAHSDTLTARELEVLRLLARGLRNKEIAARLSVSERTINFHLANIYQKLNVSGRTEALSKALGQGLITA